MRKVFLFMMLSLDGYFEGPNHDLSWHNVDPEFNAFATSQTKNVDLLFFGRKTYDLMAGYWPTEYARKNDSVVAKLMNTTPKIVFSKNLNKLQKIPYWENAELVNKNVFKRIKALKNLKGGEIGIFGSNNLTVDLIKENLVDEFRIMVNPVVIGRGTVLFKGLKKRFNLKLIKNKAFKSGNVLLVYKPQ